MKKKKIKIKKLLVFMFLIIIVVIALVFLLKRKDANKLVGIWTTDNVTVYQFNKDNTGVLILPLKNYEFTYEIDGDSLFIDFKNEKSEDSKYTYKFEDDKLILEGKNGKFIFSKYNDKKGNK